MAEAALRRVDDLPAEWEVQRLAGRLRHVLPELRQRYHIESLALFGSYVRNEQRPDSDLDMLVTFSIKPSLLGLIGLEDELRETLGVPVDVVLPSSLSERIARWVRREAVTV